MGQTDSLLREPQPKQVQIGKQRTTIAGDRERCQASLRILKEAAEFEELRDLWSTWCDHPEADIDFLAITLRHTSGFVRPHVMVVCRNGRPDCMLIGWLHHGLVTFKMGSLALFRAEARMLRFPAGGFLGNQSRGNAQFLVSEIVRSLRNHEAHAAEFSQLRVDSHLYDLAKREPNVLCREHFTPVQTHRYLRLSGSFDEFLRGRSPKSRQEFRKLTRMLERDFPGKVRFQIVRSECDVENFARKADTISRKTYQRALGAGFVNDLAMREMLRAAARKAALRACLLYVGDNPVAFAIGIVSSRTLYGTFTGYDPNLKKYRLGFQTVIRLIQDSFESSGDLLTFDAGCGDVPYKRGLFDSSWKEGPVWIFAPSPTGLRLHIVKVVSTLLHSVAMAFLARSRQLQKVKKMWHRRALREFQKRGFAEI
jgi:hypothetical protein